MGKSDFTVKCPYCSKENDFTGDNWCDELIDDSDVTNIECMYCNYPMEITTHAMYTLKVTPYEEPTQEDVDKMAENDPYRNY